jgi:hypothetical protein
MLLKMPRKKRKRTRVDPPATTVVFTLMMLMRELRYQHKCPCLAFRCKVRQDRTGKLKRGVHRPFVQVN